MTEILRWSPDNDLFVGIIAEKPSVVAGEKFRLTADTGLTLTAFLSAGKTVDDGAIDAELSISLTELGTTGYYHGTIPGADISEHLRDDYEDQDVPLYLLVRDGTSLRQFAEGRLVSGRRMAA